jgi:hypothetical protein
MQLYDQIQQLGITPERAKLLFSLAIGPLPGVSVPDGARDPHDFCGTLAVGYLYQVWNELTDAQRDKARELLATSPAARASTSRSSARLIFLQGLPFVTLHAASDDKPLLDKTP